MGLLRCLVVILVTKLLLLEVTTGKWSRSGFSRLYSPDHKMLSLRTMDYNLRNGRCTEIVSQKVPQFVPYTETYRTRGWIGIYRIKTRQNYRLEYHTTHTIVDTCCEGYQKVGSLCKPFCETPCEKGFCIIPNTCKCNAGYQIVEGTNGTKCQPICANGCINGTCVEPDICKCNEDYWMSADGITCLPICDKECESNHGFCSKPHVCSCHSGYKETNNKLSKCEPICENACINGHCIAPNVCKCADGYEKDKFDPNFTCWPKCSEDCVYGTCTAPETCTCNPGYRALNASICEPICSKSCEMGVCVAPEICSCNDGYGLIDDSVYICKPICKFNCNNGTCTAPGECTCDEGFFHDNSTETVCKPLCEIPCGPKGECTSPNNCTCFEGYRAIPSKTFNIIDNSTEKSRSICQPVCNFECVNGKCTAPNLCTCTKGYYPSWIASRQQILSFNNNTTRICKPVCETPPCGINGICIAPNVCICKHGYTKDKDNHCAPFCAQGCANGTCTEPDRCTCNNGFELRNGSVCEPICEHGCENGDCIAPNHCVCRDNFVKNTGYNFVAECIPECTRNCSRHGECIENKYICNCNFGWKGSDCEEPTMCIVTMNFNHSATHIIDRITILNDTDSATMQTLADAPHCYQCDNFLSNESLCYMISSEATAPAISCLLSIDLPCYTFHYNATFNDVKIAGPIAFIAILIVIGLTAATYLMYRRHQRNQERLIAGNSTARLMQNSSITESLICENSTDMLST